MLRFKCTIKFMFLICQFGHKLAISHGSPGSCLVQRRHAARGRHLSSIKFYHHQQHPINYLGIVPAIYVYLLLHFLLSSGNSFARIRGGCKHVYLDYSNEIILNNNSWLRPITNTLLPKRPSFDRRAFESNDDAPYDDLTTMAVFPTTYTHIRSACIFKKGKGSIIRGTGNFHSSSRL